MAEAVVVFESRGGSTGRVAESIAGGVARHLEVDLVEVGDAPASFDPAPRLLVLGGPTQTFWLPRQRASRDSASRGPRPGLQSWLHRLPQAEEGQLVATFDTTAGGALRIPGSATLRTSRLARRHGYVEATEPESFYVEHLEDPDLDTELERARQWGARLGVEVSARIGKLRS